MSSEKWTPIELVLRDVSQRDVDNMGKAGRVPGAPTAWSRIQPRIEGGGKASGIRWRPAAIDDAIRHLGAEKYGLTDTQQEVLQLTYWERMSQDEIARATDRTRPAVAKSMHLAEAKVARGPVDDPVPDEQVAARLKAIVSARRRRPFEGRAGGLVLPYDPQRADEVARLAIDGPRNARAQLMAEPEVAIRRDEARARRAQRRR